MGLIDAGWLWIKVAYVSLIIFTGAYIGYGSSTTTYYSQSFPVYNTSPTPVVNETSSSTGWPMQCQYVPLGSNNQPPECNIPYGARVLNSTFNINAFPGGFVIGAVTGALIPLIGLIGLFEPAIGLSFLGNALSGNLSTPATLPFDAFYLYLVLLLIVILIADSRK